VELTPLESAIWEVETNSRVGEIWGDNHTSLGPLQISHAAWVDSGVEGEWMDCVDLDYAVIVFRKYMERYATPERVGGSVTDENRARIWNGGPNGFRKENTIKYWLKVKRVMKIGSECAVSKGGFFH